MSTFARSSAVAVVIAVCVVVPVSVSAAGGAHASASQAIFQNRSYSPAERAADLVARMTLAEKASQMISSRESGPEHAAPAGHAHAVQQ